MENELTTGAWQDNISCPIIIILGSISDGCAVGHVEGAIPGLSRLLIMLNKEQNNLEN
jgi:hypothetical protein